MTKLAKLSEVVLELLTWILGVAAFAPLLRLGAGPLTRRFESWLFVPSETATTAVLVLAAWLLVRRWSRLRRLPVQSAPRLASALLLLGIGIYAWARYTRAGDLLIPSLMASGLGVAAWHRGLPGLRVALPPAAFLVFALPIPAPLLNEIVFRLQLVTADYAGWLLHTLGESALIAGDEIIRPDHHFVVIEGCSGMRSMETLTMIAVLQVDLFRRRGLHALLLLLCAPPVAFALNGLRVLALILNPHSEMLAIHTLQGIAILLGGLLTLYFLDGLFAHRLRGREGGEPPDDARGDLPPSDAGRRLRFALPAVALAVCVALWLWLPPWREGLPRTAVLAREIPRQLGEWQSTEMGVDHSFLGRAGSGQLLHRQYRDGSGAVELFISVGDRSARDRSPFSPTTEMPGTGWVVEERSELRLAPDGPQVTARVVRQTTRRMLVYHWYEGTSGLADEVLRSALALDSSPLRRPGQAVAVRIATEAPRGDAGELDEPRERLSRFYAELRDELGSLHAQLLGERTDDAASRSPSRQAEG